MKRLLKNKIAENLLIGIILLSNARNWVFKLVPSNNHYKPGTIRTVKRKGIWYQLDLSDYQEWLVYFYCKSDSSDYVLNYLQKSEAIFDIGANIGQTAFNMFTMQKAKKLKPIIYAFEPYPRTFSKLESNIILNKNNGIKAYNLGLSFKKGTLNMVQHSPSNSGGFRMTSNYSKDTISVPVTSLDDFIFEYQISFVDFIKIDVEGFELQVLKGAEETIKRFRPILIFEYSVQNIQVQNGDIEESLEKLKSLNYKISTKEGLSDLKSILSLDYQTDLICIPN